MTKSLTHTVVVVCYFYYIQVGLGCVTAILNQDICGTIAMVDINKTKLEGEAKDFQQGGGFHQTTTILASDQYDVSAKSDLVIITAGVAQKPGESRLSLVERNAKIMSSIMPQVLQYSPQATILVVSNPCDIMTALAAKMAGPNFPQGKVFGAGTNLDSSRFQMLIAGSMDLVSKYALFSFGCKVNKVAWNSDRVLSMAADSFLISHDFGYLAQDPRNVHGYIIGEHGDSSIPVWSSVRVGALPLLDPGQEPDETLKSIHKAVVNSAMDVINLKGYTNWYVFHERLLSVSRTLPVSASHSNHCSLSHDPVFRIHFCSRSIPNIMP